MSESGKPLPPRARRFIAQIRAFRTAMQAWAAHRGGVGTGGGADGYGDITFHWEVGPGHPRLELRLFADMADDGSPVIRVTLPEQFDPEPGMPLESAADRSTGTAERHLAVSRDVALRGTGLPLVEPDQRCEACGAEGTVGRATRFTAAGAIHEMHRFCADCWPEERARYEARWQHQRDREHDARVRGEATAGWTVMSSSFESATWDGARTLIARLQEGAVPAWLARREMRRIADEILDTRDRHVGRMPLDVVAFVVAHTSRVLSPDILSQMHGRE